MKCEFEMRTTAGYTLRVVREESKNWLQITSPHHAEVSVLMSDEELRRLKTSIEAVLL